MPIPGSWVNLALGLCREEGEESTSTVIGPVLNLASRAVPPEPRAKKGYASCASLHRSPWHRSLATYKSFDTPQIGEDMSIQAFSPRNLATLGSPRTNVLDKTTLHAPLQKNKAQPLGIYRDSISAHTYKLIPPKYLCPISMQPMTGKLRFTTCPVILKEFCS